MPGAAVASRHDRAPVARWRMKRLTSTATSSIAPRKTWNQSASTPAKTMPWLTMPKISAPKHGADDRAVAAGQQRTADDHRDDRVELAGLSPRSTSVPVKVTAWIIATSQADAAVPMKSSDLDPVDRHADVARGLDAAADAEDPVAE